MAQAREGQNVQIDQVLLCTPVLSQKRSAGADARSVDQQVDLVGTVFQLQQKAREPQWLAQIAGSKQHFHAKTLSQFQCNCFQQVALAGDQDQVATATCQRFGHRQAYAAGRAGDQGVTGHAFLH